MFVIEVIPLAALPSSVPQILSYFFDKKLERGTIIEGLIGNRNIKGVVVDSVPLAEYKIGLKKAEFQLKKLTGVLFDIPQISDRQIHIALWLSKTYYIPLGMCLKAILPPFLFKKNFPVEPEPRKQTEEVKRKPSFILTNAKNTLNNIRPIISHAVTKGGQVVLVVPDNQTINHFYENLKDFESAKVYSELGNKKLHEAWQNVQSGKTKLLIGTKQALLFPFKDLSLVIADDPLHESYKSEMSPKYNASELAKHIAEMNNCRLVFISPISGVDNYHRLKEKTYELLDKTEVGPEIKTVNMVSEIKSSNFSIFSRELRNEITKDQKILIFSPRRGHSGIIICQNCGWTAKCPNCEIAYRIHRSEDLILMCHHCNNTQRLPEHCPNCNSSKLKPTGPAGSQKIYEEVRKILSQNEISGVPVLILDTDVTANPTEEEEVMNEIAKPGKSILIATQMVFSYRYSHIFDFVVVMNADSLIQSPDFRTEERLLYQLEKLSDFKPQEILIQTFNPENQAIAMWTQKGFKSFYEKELAIRQALTYPPFSRLIKLTFRHPNREVASREARVLAGKLKMAVMQLQLSDKMKISDSSPGYTEKERGLYTYNIVIKSLTGQTPKEILKYIPPRWIIDVDPRSLL